MNRWVLGSCLAPLVVAAAGLRIVLPYADPKLTDQEVVTRAIALMSSAQFSFAGKAPNPDRSGETMQFKKLGCGGLVSISPLEIAQVNEEDSLVPTGYRRQFIFDDWSSSQLDRRSVLWRRLIHGVSAALRLRGSINLDKVLKVTAPARCPDIEKVSWRRLWRPAEGHNLGDQEPS